MEWRCLKHHYSTFHHLKRKAWILSRRLLLESLSCSLIASRKDWQSNMSSSIQRGYRHTGVIWSGRLTSQYVPAELWTVTVPSEDSRVYCVVACRTRSILRPIFVTLTPHAHRILSWQRINQSIHSRMELATSCFAAGVAISVGNLARKSRLRGCYRRRAMQDPRCVC